MKLMSMIRTGALFLPLHLLAGCNTVSGAGQDITGMALFVQGYMPAEMQKAGSDRYVADAFAGGVPPLGGV